MTIILDPANKKPPIETRAEPVERETDGERSALLPPSYSPADDREHTLPAPVGAKQTQNRNRHFLRRAAAGTGLLVLIVLALVHLLRGSSLGGGEDWMTPPAADGKPTTPSALPLPPRHTHERHPSWPNQPFFARTINVDLPLSSANPDFFLHALGVDAVGEIKMVPEDDNLKSDGVVRVEISVIYASEERLKERVRIWKTQDEDGRLGVDILTPDKPIWNRRPVDHIAFKVTIHLPARLASSSGSTVLLGGFDGEATGMKMDIGDLGVRWRLASFAWRSRNSYINVESLNSHVIDLSTTNGHIALLSSPQYATGLNATTVHLKTTNANVDLVKGTVKASASVHIESTNGHVATREKSSDGSDDPVQVEGGIIDIRTTNEAILGSFRASSISAVTTNAKISGAFSGFSKLLNLKTTNAPLTAQITPASHASTTPIPITLHTTSGFLSATFSSRTSVLPTINGDLSTTNDKLEVHAPEFNGAFEFKTSAYSGLEVTGEGVVVDQAGKGILKGVVRWGERQDGGWIKGTTSNAAVKVAF